MLDGVDMRRPSGILTVVAVALFMIGVGSVFFLDQGGQNGVPAAQVSQAPSPKSSSGSSIRPVLAGGAIGVTGTLLGTVVTSILGWFRDKRLYREQTAMAVAKLEQTIWLWGAAGGAGLRTELQTVTLQLRAAGVDDQLRGALASVTAACWWDGENQHSRTHGEGIDAHLLNLRQEIEQAVVGELLQLGSHRVRRELRQSAFQHFEAASLTLPAVPIYY